MLCLPLLVLFTCGVHAIKLSVPLLVVNKGDMSQGTVYLLDATGRSDVIAQTLKGQTGFDKATVEKFVPLSKGEKLVETLPDLKGNKNCREYQCPGVGQSCYQYRTSNITDVGGPKKLLEEIQKIKGQNGQSCKVVFSANEINTTTTLFRNAWAPMEATMFSITAILVVVLFVVAVLPSLLIKDSDIMPEVDTKTD